LWWKCFIPIRLTAALFPSLCNPNIPKTSDFPGSLRFETLLLDLRVKPGGLSSAPRVFGIKLSVFSVDRSPLLTAQSNAG
jgi:hypothetical protein